MDTDKHGLLDSLAAREREVLQLMAEGLASKEIADRLDISVNTVRVYRERIYSKLRVNGLAQAVLILAAQPPDDQAQARGLSERKT